MTTPKFVYVTTGTPSVLPGSGPSAVLVNVPLDPAPPLEWEIVFNVTANPPSEGWPRVIASGGRVCFVAKSPDELDARMARIAETVHLMNTETAEKDAAYTSILERLKKYGG